MPHDTEALHEIAALMFSDIRAETLGWQMMFEAFTGLRTCEALRMRTDAQPYEPGWITKDGKSLCVRRAKNQESVNPFVRVHEGLAAVVKSARGMETATLSRFAMVFSELPRPGRKARRQVCLVAIVTASPEHDWQKNNQPRHAGILCHGSPVAWNS